MITGPSNDQHATLDLIFNYDFSAGIMRAARLNVLVAKYRNGRLHQNELAMQPNRFKNWDLPRQNIDSVNTAQDHLNGAMS